MKIKTCVGKSNFDKFKFLSMTLKIERVFEKNKQYVESKTGQKGYEFSNQIGPQPMQNFLHEEKIHFFCKIKSLYTINNLCVLIEIIAS